MQVFVTGSSSCLSHAVLPQLCADPSIERVVGIDLRPTRYAHPKFSSKIMDMRAPELESYMKGSHAVVHLGYAVMREQLSDTELHDNNVNGTLKTMEIAKINAIAKFINMSSVSVYGRGEGLTESSPLNPSAKFIYAKHKAEIETISQQRHPNVVHIRSHLIFGRNCQKFLRDMVNSPVYIKPPSPMPVLQVIHETDVASAILLCLKKDVSGAFNVAAPEVMSIPDLVKHQRRRVVPIPLGVAKNLVSVGKFLGSKDEFTWLEVMDTTLTVSSDRAGSVLGWSAQYTAWDAVIEMQKASQFAA
jgi:UDP-glucose 4-epimerase